ncbi:MAG: hypothetical protein ISS35_05820 [Kiritimatiellae bacterium]|nr:hypothetical protein [Kiritimatiellia bacterium]
MKIRTKLVGIVSVALLLPLLLGLFYVRRIGESYYLKQKGILYLTIAKELADAMETGVRNEFSHVRNWIEISPLLDLVQAVELAPLNMERVQQVEEIWPELSPDDEPLRTILTGPLAQHLNVFSRMYPVFAEIMVTDRFGCLIGATNPTTDYWQADEAWWRKTFHARGCYSSSLNKRCKVVFWI